jgi:hypothetical protein
MRPRVSAKASGSAAVVRSSSCSDCAWSVNRYSAESVPGRRRAGDVGKRLRNLEK